MNDIVTIIQAVIRDQLRSFKTAEFAAVTKVYSHEMASDRNNYQCDVRLRASGLELKRIPVSTQRIGSVAIPNVDDLVLVQFLHGDIHSAVITGRLYNDTDRPPEAKPHENIYVSPDEAEKNIRRFYLELPNNNKLLLDDDKLVLEMGKTTLTINNSGDVVLNSNAKLTIDTKGDTAVKVQGNLEFNATGDVNLEGTNVSIKGKSSAALEGNGSATLKGASVKIAGMTDFSAA
ncbi:MAG: phage baseplate assembly protein V [Candidatus Aminicenantes bacterium]|jgi:phage baseplate assembly protein gpV